MTSQQNKIDVQPLFAGRFHTSLPAVERVAFDRFVLTLTGPERSKFQQEMAVLRRELSRMRRRERPDTRGAWV